MFSKGTPTLAAPLPERWGTVTSERHRLDPDPVSDQNKTRTRKDSPEMKRVLFAIMAVTLVVGLTGCSAWRRGFTGLIPGSCHDAPEDCASCGDCGDCGEATCQTDRAPCNRCRDCLIGRRCRAREFVNPGPPTGAVTYPYYTLRGPRDFLVDNPPSIGP